jgi:hypothetical protein
VKTDISQALAGLDRLKKLALDGAVAGLQGVAGPAAERLRQDAPHGDVTGATRASYSAYVVAPGVDGGPAIRRGLAEAEARNPGYGQEYSAGAIGEDVVLVTTAFTSYFADLINRNAGEADQLSLDMINQSPTYTQAAADGIRRKLGGG